MRLGYNIVVFEILLA